MLGIIQMIRNVTGDNHCSKEDYESIIGNTIKSMLINDSDELIIEFKDGVKVKIWDYWQKCCEARYMHTDDDLNYHNGCILHEIKINDGPTIDYGCEEKECQFLNITTSNGVITIANYNKHNGYYGGFCLRMKRID